MCMLVCAFVCMCSMHACVLFPDVRARVGEGTSGDVDLCQRDMRRLPSERH